MAIVVSDTSPIRALAHLGHLAWLDEVFDGVGVVLPPAVADELVHPPPGLPRVEVASWAFLCVQSPQSTQRVGELRATLDLGEAEAIVLAEEIQADAVLMDELAGRAVAMDRGITVVGTLGVLLRAKRKALCPEVRPLLDQLQQEIRFFVSPRLRQHVLAQAGESDA